MQLETPGAQTVIGRAQTAIHDSEDGVIIIAGRRYLTPERLAQILRKSTRTLARWDEQRIGPRRKSRSENSRSMTKKNYPDGSPSTSRSR